MSDCNDVILRESGSPPPTGGPGPRARRPAAGRRVTTGLAAILLALSLAGPVAAAGGACEPGTTGDAADVPLTAPPRNLERENALADRLDLSRMRDTRMVRRFLRAGRLVRVPSATRTFTVEGVSAALRVARPWTKRFVEQLALAAHQRFGTRLRITSLTRTEAVQASLGRWNGNAAPARGPRRSSHLTGASVDISKQPLGEEEIRWLRSVLRALEARGLVTAIEEFVQPHFHVLVLPRFARNPRTARAVLAGVPCHKTRDGAAGA